MDSNKNFYSQTMDDIVFDNRNKGYGAYDLRTTYQKHLLYALGISVFIFVFGLYSPKLAHNLGLLSDEDEIEEVTDTTSVQVLEQTQDPNEPPPPPPPPPVEITPPTVAFLEMLAVKKELADQEAPPTQEKLETTEAGTTTQAGDPNATPIVIDDNIGTGPVVDDKEKLYTQVDQKAAFKGGDDAFKQFLEENLIYPEAARAYGIAGTTTVYFVVSVTGAISDVSVSKTSGSTELDNEAIRVIKKCSGRFNPAKLDGRAVKAPCSIPITFELDE